MLKPIKAIMSAPILNYTLRIANSILHLPSYRDALIKDQHQLREAITEKGAAVEDIRQELTILHDKFQHLTGAHDNLQSQMRLLDKSKSAETKKTTTNSSNELFAEDHLLDVFYTNFEDRFRGAEDIIKERQTEYLSDLRNSGIDFKKFPVLDIGSGRGEFLELLKENKISAVGLDINIDMVDRANQKGLKAYQGDALTFLEETKSQTYGAITGFHIVEHIPFNALLRIFANARAALVENGFVLFETPNPENIIVGSCAFYMDPSHLHPLPPDLLAFALENSGFRNVTIRRIHPVDNYEKGDMPEEFINRFYGPRDYVVIGYK